jgi:hydroxymethylpyrimidine/phosphomethylpyrimidine kinase
MQLAAPDLLLLGPKAVLLKGGHLENTDQLVDILVFKEGDQIISQTFYHPKIQTKNSHGTGCSLSTAIACGLGAGLSLAESVDVGIEFVQQALIHAREMNLAQGAGPIWHAYEQFPQLDLK